MPPWAVWPANEPITLAVAVHGALPLSKPGLPSFWPGLGQAPAALTVKVNDWLAVAWVGVALSVTLTVVVDVAAVVGVRLQGILPLR